MTGEKMLTLYKSRTDGEILVKTCKKVINVFLKIRMIEIQKHYLKTEVFTILRNIVYNLIGIEFTFINRCVLLINKKLIALRFPRIPYICSEKIETSYFLWEYSQEILTVGCED